MDYLSKGLRKAKKWLAYLGVLVILFQESYMHVYADTRLQDDIATEGKILQVEDSNYSTNVELIGGMLQNSNVESEKEYIIAEYISVYNADTDIWFYLYPIISDEECYYLAHVDGTGNIVITEDTEVYDAILQLEKEKEAQYIIYVTGGIYYAECKGEVVELDEIEYVDVEVDEAFCQLSYTEKISFFYSESGLKSSYCSLNESDIIVQCKSNEIMTSSSISMLATTPETVTSKCGITKFVKQGNLGLCWAASVATIVNYKLGYSFNARNIADAMGMTYEEGGNCLEIQAALAKYGLSYEVRAAKISWTQVKQNIDTDRPFVMKLSGDAAHVITGYGYSCAKGDLNSYSHYRMIYAWDSNEYQLLLLYNSSTIITSGYTLTWEASVY